MTGKSFHLDPEKERPAAGANLLERLRCGVINLFHILSIDSAPVVRLENIQRERIGRARRHADAVGVVFDEKEHGKLLLLGKKDRFKKIPLASRCIDYDRHDKSNVVLTL